MTASEIKPSNTQKKERKKERISLFKQYKSISEDQ